MHVGTVQPTLHSIRHSDHGPRMARWTTHARDVLARMNAGDSFSHTGTMSPPDDAPRDAPGISEAPDLLTLTLTREPGGF